MNSYTLLIFLSLPLLNILPLDTYIVGEKSYFLLKEETQAK